MQKVGWEELCLWNSEVEGIDMLYYTLRAPPRGCIYWIGSPHRQGVHTTAYKRLSVCGSHGAFHRL